MLGKIEQKVATKIVVLLLSVYRWGNRPITGTCLSLSQSTHTGNRIEHSTSSHYSRLSSKYKKDLELNSEQGMVAFGCHVSTQRLKQGE